VNIQYVAADSGRVNTHFAIIDALPWQEIVKLSDEELSEHVQLSDDEDDALSGDERAAMFARDEDRLRRKYCGKLPEEIEEERDFDPSGEPEAFRRIWATDLAALTHGQLRRLRERKWPDDLDPDDVSDEGRALWHRRVWTMLRHEFEVTYAASKNPRNIAHFLLTDIYELAEQALARKHSEQRRTVGAGAQDAVEAWQRKELQALLDNHNARIDGAHKLSDNEALTLIAELGIELAAAKTARDAERAERIVKTSTKEAATWDDLTRCPGLVGKITDWVCATAQRPNRIFALGVAVTVIGTLIGRRLCGPTDSGTHLYILALAPTGSGKDHYLTSVSTLLTAGGGSHLIGPDSFMSESAVINHMVSRPLSLCAMDEFGAFVAKINNPRASVHDKAISKTLRTAWGRSFKQMSTPQWAGKDFLMINAPALSILGASTAKEFFDAISDSDLSNGFMNRFLVLVVDKRPAAQKPDPTKVPDDLKNLIKDRCRPFWITLTDDNGRPSDRLYDAPINPTKIGWADNRAEALYDAYADEILARIDKNEDIGHFISRNAETAVRLATIRAVGRAGDNATVDLADMRWGIDFVRLASDAVVAKASTTMIDEHLTHGKLHRKLFDIIKDAGKSGICQRDLARKVQRQAKTKEVHAVLGQLIDSGTIVSFWAPAGGPPLSYRLP
jgi:hypothetical protein